MSLCSIYKGFIIIERISHKMVCFKLSSCLEETYQIMIEVIILYNNVCIKICWCSFCVNWKLLMSKMSWSFHISFVIFANSKLINVYFYFHFSYTLSVTPLRIKYTWPTRRYIFFKIFYIQYVDVHFERINKCSNVYFFR